MATITKSLLMDILTDTMTEHGVADDLIADVAKDCLDRIEAEFDGEIDFEDDDDDCECDECDCLCDNDPGDED